MKSQLFLIACCLLGPSFAAAQTEFEPATPALDAKQPAHLAPSVYVIVDETDDSGQVVMLTKELEAAGNLLEKRAETLDTVYMPIVSQIRYYSESDKSAAERALPTLKKFRPRAISYLHEDPSKRGRVDLFLSRRDDYGSRARVPMQAVAPPPPSPPSITDEALREVFDPEDTSTDPLKSAPRSTRAFLAAAKQADGIDDSMARCLAYPDLPGSHWSPSIVRALCEYHYSRGFGIAELKGYLAHKDIDGLESRLEADLQAHLERGNARSERIDHDFASFPYDADAGESIRAWRRLAPGSAFALTAEAALLTGEAWRARGFGFSSDISADQFAEMHRLAGQAVDAAQAALRIEPKLLPAWIVLMQVGQLEGRDDLVVAAYDNAIRIDPACYAAIQARMMSLRRRWGGQL